MGHTLNPLSIIYQGKGYQVNKNTGTPSLKFYKCDNLHSNIPTQKIHFSPQIGSVALWSESVAATREFVGCSSFERMAVKLNHWL